MSDQQPVWQRGEDVQVLENALADSSLEPRTRRTLVERAGMTLLGVGGIGTLVAACGSSSKKKKTTTSTHDSGSAAEIKTIIDTAATAEALAVTYLTAVVKSSAGTPVAKFNPILKAANAEEYDHYKALTSLGAKPLTTKFWVPNAFFGPHLSGVFPTLEVAETLFVNAYLIAMTTFAKAGKSNLVRYASEISGVEAQHLALARFGAGKLPNDLGFTEYTITSINGIVAALEKVGVGFGKKSSAPGKFATFSPPPASAVIPVKYTTPM